MKLCSVLCALSSTFIVRAAPFVYTGSSPSGDAVIAISSSDPAVEKRFAYDHPRISSRNNNQSPRPLPTPNHSPKDEFNRIFSLVAPGKAIAGTGRSFASTYQFLPTFMMPLSLESFGLSNFNSVNWIKRIEDLFEPSFLSNFSNGETRTVTAVNDNGRVYGEVKTVTLDDKGKKHTVKSVIH